MSIIQFLLLTVSVIMAVTMVLTALLLYAKARLTPSGK